MKQLGLVKVLCFSHSRQSYSIALMRRGWKGFLWRGQRIWGGDGGGGQEAMARKWGGALGTGDPGQWEVTFPNTRLHFQRAPLPPAPAPLRFTELGFLSKQAMTFCIIAPSSREERGHVPPGPSPRLQKCPPFLQDMGFSSATGSMWQTLLSPHIWHQ